MTEAELRELFESTEVTMALVAYKDGPLPRGTGVAIELGENLSRTWQSGDIVVFWTDGEHTVLPDSFEFVRLLGAADWTAATVTPR